MQMEIKYLKELEHRKLNFRKAKYNELSTTINSIDWSFIQNLNINDAVRSFYAAINRIINDSVPLYMKRRHPFWYSRECICLIKKKDKLRAKWKKKKGSVIT